MPGAVGAGVIGGAGSGALEAQDFGGTLGQRGAAAAVGGALGATEGIPVARMLGRIAQGDVGLLRRMLMGAAEEGIQETGQTIGSNIGAREIGYDPSRPVMQGVPESAAAGMLIGGGMNTVSGRSNIIPAPEPGSPVQPSGYIKTPQDFQYELVDPASSPAITPPSSPAITPRRFTPGGREIGAPPAGDMYPDVPLAATEPLPPPVMPYARPSGLGRIEAQRPVRGTPEPVPSPYPPRTADTMSDAIAMSSPSGKMSKRASRAADEGLKTDLFGAGGLQKPQAPPSTPQEQAETLRMQANDLRALADRGMRPRVHRKRAAELDSQADSLAPVVQESLTTAQPITVFRGSPTEEMRPVIKPETGLFPGIHVGTTREQAENAARNFKDKQAGWNVKQYALNVKNPLRLNDNDVYGARSMAEALTARGMMDNAEAMSIRDTPEDAQKVIDAIKSKGYDSIVYQNDAEGEGDSYVVLDQGQLTETPREEVMPNEEGQGQGRQGLLTPAKQGAAPEPAGAAAPESMQVAPDVQSELAVDVAQQGKQAWEMTYDEVRDAVAPGTPEALQASRPIIRDLYSDMLGDPGDPWGLVRAVERGDEYPRTPTTDLSKRHKASIQKALAEALPVPRAVLQDYAGEDWADAALAKLPNPSETPNSSPIATEPAAIATGQAEVAKQSIEEMPGGRKSLARRKAKIESIQRATQGAQAIELTVSQDNGVWRHIIHPSSKESGKWQVSIIAPDGEPWGDTILNSREAAIEDVFHSRDDRMIDLVAASPRPQSTHPASSIPESKLTTREADLIEKLLGAKPRQGQIYPTIEDVGGTKRELAALKRKGMIDEGFGTPSINARIHLDYARGRNPWEGMPSTKPPVAPPETAPGDSQPTPAPLPRNLRPKRRRGQSGATINPAAVQSAAAQAAGVASEAVNTAARRAAAPVVARVKSAALAVGNRIPASITRFIKNMTTEEFTQTPAIKTAHESFIAETRKTDSQVEALLRTIVRNTKDKAEMLAADRILRGHPADIENLSDAFLKSINTNKADVRILAQRITADMQALGLPFREEWLNADRFWYPNIWGKHAARGVLGKLYGKPAKSMAIRQSEAAHTVRRTSDRYTVINKRTGKLARPDAIFTTEAEAMKFVGEQGGRYGIRYKARDSKDAMRTVVEYFDTPKERTDFINSQNEDGSIKLDDEMKIVNTVDRDALVVIHPMTPEQMRAHGLIEDLINDMRRFRNPMNLVAKTRFFDTIAKHLTKEPEWFRTGGQMEEFNDPDFRRVSDLGLRLPSSITNPDIRQFMEGSVHKDLAADLIGAFGNKNSITSILMRPDIALGLRRWVTYRNPFRYPKQVFENNLQLYIADATTFADTPHRIAANAEFWSWVVKRDTTNPVMREFTESGILETDFLHSTEIENIGRRMSKAQSLEEFDETMLETISRHMAKVPVVNKAGDVDRFLHTLYNLQDAAYKYQLYSHLRNRGKTPDEAKQRTIDTMFSWDRAPRIIQKLRFIPFMPSVLWQFSRVLTNKMALDPVSTLLKLALTTAAFAMVRDETDELAGITKADRQKSIPLLRSMEIALPVTDSQGRTLKFDTSFMFPYSDLAPLMPSDWSRVRQIRRRVEPMWMQSVDTLMTQQSPFGRDLYFDKTKDPDKQDEQTKEILLQATSDIMPGMLGAYWISQYKNAQRTPGRKQDWWVQALTGPTGVRAAIDYNQSPSRGRRKKLSNIPKF
ncbi:MAG: hypothetical protein ABFD89_15290 [Bryobacteraceae bacterium]